MKKINTTYLIALSALVFASCSESNELSSGIPLSKEKIAFAANVVNGWNGNSHTRVQNGIAEYHGPLKVTSNTKQQLYLHPIIQNGVYFYNQEGELVTRDGIAISKGGNKIISTTRGSLAQDVNSGFGISAIYNDGTTDKAYFVNNKATKVGDLWFTENKDKWPDSTNGLSFYAYAPHSNDNRMLRLAGGDKIAQSKQIQYEASSTDIVNQPDFVVANSKDNKLVSGKAQPSVNLTFSHALTAISFVAAKDILSGTVKSVSFKNVKGNGIYNLETGIWTSADTPMDFTLLLGTDGNGVTVNGTSDIALTSGTQNFMMIPQRFTSDDSKVVMELEEADGTSYHLEAPLKTEWQAGHTVTYRLSSSSLLPGLEITTVSYPQDWVGKYKVDGKSVFNSAYKKDDSIGIYAINAGGEVTQANVKATYDGTKWSLPGGEKLRNNATISYFAYFPYVKDGDQKLASMPRVGDPVSPDDLSSEHAFFKGLEDNWEVKDQSTLEKLNAADLQVCKAVLDKTASGLNLTMQHGVGLADITLGQGLNYKLENYEKYKWTASIVSDRFESRKMYKPEGKKVIGIVRANQNTELKGITSDWKGSWKSALTFKPGYANIQTATAVRADDEEHFYKFGLGAVYYSDGSISNQVEDLMPDKYPVGIVVYIPAATGVDKWSERGSVIGNSKIGGHGLVMALKNVGSTGNNEDKGRGAVYQWWTDTSSGSLTGLSSDNFSFHFNSQSQIQGSGYYLSKKIESGSSAVNAAKGYQPSYDSNSKIILNGSALRTTGWFLPSLGQCYAAIYATCGGLSNDLKWDVYLTTTNGSTNVSQKINEYLYKAAGASNLNEASSNYTYFSDHVDYWIWTSSEVSSESAVPLRMGVKQGSAHFPYWRKTDKGMVRPFLAF